MNTKTCTGCHLEQPIEEFARRQRNKATRESRCRTCKNTYAREYQKKRRLEIRKIIKKAKDCPCQDCGQSYPTRVMDFDHVRGVKKFSIASYAHLNYNRRFQILLNEIAKCDVVCANCHRLRHDEDDPLGA